MKNIALFLDRDGVINIDKNYIYKIEDVEFVDGILDLIIHAKNLGYLVIIITNQSGIGRGIFTEEDFKKVNLWILNDLKKNGAIIDDVYYCPTHPTEGIGEYKKIDNRRKPNSGMFFEAAKDYNIDLAKSTMLGDKTTDMDAGFSSGIKNLFFLSEEIKYQGSKNVSCPKDVINFLNQKN